MSRSQEGIVSAGEKKYKGVRRRKWGKYVSEIRVPGSHERLWLGSYTTPEAAAVARDTAVYFLRGPDWSHDLNFPHRVAMYAWAGLSPRSIQRVASDSGMAVDAQLMVRGPEAPPQPPTQRAEVGVMESINWRQGGEHGLYEVSEFGGDICIDDTDIYM
ncbi:ethylene-responsive transcription factor ERF020-like [Phoenix dactylifera]|uniref:Ethylene-responsive transcription factor ERF020-like n=1 Tax=Phoenix dactylifera TaxID=42345 RepID=A0A8B7BJE0_PHODC|nr:ethylene-responsive transcription factor ERF020-like [Phoenix dactylifera]XP_038978937.1 ethylene-responsive transcription factor ERF020-like [Phoenix dactylifera]